MSKSNKGWKGTNVPGDLKKEVEKVLSVPKFSKMSFQGYVIRAVQEQVRRDKEDILKDVQFDRVMKLGKNLSAHASEPSG